ncbi:MAG: site-2 protease family protein [Planctomycetota bacterium]|nr:site-2 protease family protein [Planctomycetota bacterium]
MTGWWLSDIWHLNPVFALAWLGWVIVSITLHELAHGWVAILCGDDVPIRSGHMTWNPTVHIPFPWAWIMLALFGFTWGLMPVQPANFRGRYDDAKVSFAGPAMNLLLAAVCLVLDVAWLTFMTSTPDPFHANVHTVLWTGLMINLMGFMFNLLPVPPLDGSHILRSLVPAYRRIWEGPNAAMYGMAAFAALFLFGGRYVWEAVHTTAAFAVRAGLTLAGGDWRSPI